MNNDQYDLAPDEARRLAKPKLELFAFHVANGNTLVEAYKLAVAKPSTTHESAAVGGSRLAAIPGVRARIAYLREQIIDAEITASALPEQGLLPKTPREILIARMWRVAHSPRHSDALAAIKLLHRWLPKD
jgi:hypothetical protein